MIKNGLIKTIKVITKVGRDMKYKFVTVYVWGFDGMYIETDKW